MKLITLCLFSLILLCSVNAEITQQEINDKQACINKIVLPCGNGDTACKTELERVDQCFKSQGTFPTFKELYDAIKKNCKSDNPAIQKTIGEYLNCVSSTIVVFSLLASLFALLF